MRKLSICWAMNSRWARLPRKVLHRRLAAGSVLHPRQGFESINSSPPSSELAGQLPDQRTDHRGPASSGRARGRLRREHPSHVQAPQDRPSPRFQWNIHRRRLRGPIRRARDGRPYIFLLHRGGLREWNECGGSEGLLRTWARVIPAGHAPSSASRRMRGAYSSGVASARACLCPPTTFKYCTSRPAMV